MARVRASCPECGDVSLEVDDIHVRVCTDNDSGSYHFKCPSCDWIVYRDASERIVGLLQSSGAPCEEWRLPTELRESHAGDPITHDDILDFHFAIQQDGWESQLVEKLNSETGAHE